MSKIEDYIDEAVLNDIRKSISSSMDKELDKTSENPEEAYEKISNIKKLYYSLYDTLNIYRAVPLKSIKTKNTFINNRELVFSEKYYGEISKKLTNFQKSKLYLELYKTGREISRKDIDELVSFYKFPEDRYFYEKLIKDVNMSRNVPLIVQASLADIKDIGVIQKKMKKLTIRKKFEDMIGYKSGIYRD